jgi:23S rRNA pseudouridine1911/1915/1917 synthase
MEVVYEDNHIIIVYKESGEIVQGDKTGDRPLSDIVKDYIKEKYQKPGAVFLGVVHRLDRPVSGLVVFARTSKALTRLNNMFRDGEVHKTYWAIVSKREDGRGKTEEVRRKTEEGRGEMDDSSHTLEHWLVRNEKQNKSYAYDHEVPNSKKAILKYRIIGHSDRYTLLEVNLLTGRHHQIRCQLAAMGCPIKGDLKYGAKRSNPDGSISLLSHRVEFIHPVSKERIVVESPLPNDPLWQTFK